MSETYRFLASDGSTYEATLEEIREWYDEKRITPDDYLTQISTNEDYRVRDLLESPALDHEDKPARPPVVGQTEFPPEDIENHLFKALIATLCVGCLPIGVVGLVYATQVDGLVKRGDHAAALEASEKANSWSTASILLGMAGILIYMMAQCSS